MRRRPWLVAVTTTFAIGLATRLAPLWWSPLPATLDGLVYARDVTDTLAYGHLALQGFTADAITSTVLFAVAAAITDVAPIRLAQPLYALIGTTTVLLGFLFARQLGVTWQWSPARIRTAGVLAAAAIATEGLLVRRTGVPDDDAITLVLIPITAWVAYRLAHTGRARWAVPLGALLVVFPLTHTFSTLVLVLTLTTILAVRLLEPGTWRATLWMVALVGGFWVYFAAYYQWAGRLGLSVPYVGRITSHPGLFVAWVILMVALAVWFRRWSPRGQRLAVLAPLALFFAVVAANALVAVFPGTAQTPRLVLMLVAPLAVPAVLAAWGSPLFGHRNTIATVLLALSLAPIAQILFSLTASLTPEFWATAMRAQTHVHLPVLVLAAGVVSGVVTREDHLSARLAGAAGPVLVGVLVLSVVATLPLAYVNLDTGSYPSTTTQSEFAAAGFAATYITGPWATSHTLGRVGGYYFGGNTTYQPTVSWLNGGPTPACPVLSKQSWTTTGAHLFPAAPATLPADQYDRWLTERDRIYAVNGYDVLTVTLPDAESRQQRAAGC